MTSRFIVWCSTFELTVTTSSSSESMSGTHRPKSNRMNRGAAGPDDIGTLLVRDAGGSRTRLELLCRQRPYRLAPASVVKVPSLGIEPRPRPSQSRVQDPPHSKDNVFQYPAEESNPVRQIRSLSCCPSHSQGIKVKEPTTGFAPASTALQERSLSQSSHVGNKHERKESNPVRQVWKLAALPGAHSCSCKRSRQLEPGAIVVNYFASSTFQYASLMNFDQLSMRTSCAV